MARLSADIRGGRLAPGARLPTEQALTPALGVSRTVVREAVAALRADGLVVTRRGSGAYVADPSAGPSASPRPAPRPERHPRRDGAAARGRGRGGGACRRARQPPPDRRHPRGVARHRPGAAARRGRGRRGLRLPSRHRRGHRQPRSSRASWPFSAAMSSRARACGSRLTRRPNGALILSASSTSTRASCPAFPTRIPPRRGAPCASISRARSSAIATWQEEKKNGRR